jgi:hypothetical protein
MQHFGKIVLKSAPFPFDTSKYYLAEMGPDLVRHWYCFEELFGADSLPSYRMQTGEIEAKFAPEGKRRINLDPGYLDLGKLVLASYKGAADKIYLGRGVWAHTCLRFRAGHFAAPDHSFPDFQDGRFDPFMLAAREKYKSLLRHRAHLGHT